MPEIPDRPTRWRVDSLDSVIQVKLPDPGETLTVHNDGEHFWVTNEQDRESAYQAGREDESRDALIIRGDLDITTVLEALVQARSAGGDLGRAAQLLLQRYPPWMGSDGHYRPAGPHQLDQLHQDERRAGREDEARSQAAPDAPLGPVLGYLYVGPGGKEMLFDPADITIIRQSGEDQDTPEGSDG